MERESIVRGKNIDLIPFSDLFLTPRYVSWLNDPKVTRWSELRHSSHSLESAQGYVNSMQQQGNPFWAIVHRESQTHIGNLSAYINRANQTGELSILIGESAFHGKGYAKEAWSLGIDALFDQAQLRKVHAGTMSSNLPMIHVMKACGMKPDGVRVRHLVCEGSEVDVQLFAVFNSERIK